MSEAKVSKYKMTVAAQALTFAFSNGTVNAIDLASLKPEVVQHLALLGAKTGMRNSTIVDGDEKAKFSETELVAEMASRQAKYIAALEAGNLRVTREAGEAGYTSTLDMEAFTVVFVSKNGGKLANEVTSAEVSDSIKAVTETVGAWTDETLERAKGTKLFVAALSRAKAIRADARATKQAKDAAGEEDIPL